MLEKLAGIEKRYEELNQMLLEVGDDYQRAAELGKERSDLEPIVGKAQDYHQAMARLEEARELQNNDDEELRLLAEAEIAEVEPEVERLESEIKRLLLPKDPRDDRNVIVEIRAGTGGDEAALFAADLFRMYSRYAERQHWKVEVLSANEIGIGGFKEIIFVVKGKGAYSRLKYESGVHRVQRVPVTEARGASTPPPPPWPCWPRWTRSKSISPRATSTSMSFDPPARAARTSRRTPPPSA